MAKQRRRPVRRRDRKGAPTSSRRKPCPYCRDKVDQVDYKNLSMLRRFISERGKIRSRRITGACRRHQSQVARAVKRASWRCCRTSPRARAANAAREAVATATATATVRTAPLMPQAILLQDVDALGERGTVIDVSAGYLRNYLLPRKLAEPATTASIQAAKRRRDDAERAVQEAEDRARDNAATLGRTVLTIPQQAGDDGRLFGSVTTQDISDAIRDARGIKIDRRKIHLEDPIRHTGTYMVVVEVTDEVTATVKTMVVAA